MLAGRVTSSFPRSRSQSPRSPSSSSRGTAPSRRPPCRHCPRSSQAYSGRGVRCPSRRPHLRHLGLIASGSSPLLRADPRLGAAGRSALGPRLDRPASSSSHDGGFHQRTDHVATVRGAHKPARGGPSAVLHVGLTSATSATSAFALARTLVSSLSRNGAIAHAIAAALPLATTNFRCASRTASTLWRARPHAAHALTTAAAWAPPLSALPQPKLLRQQTLQRRHLGQSLERRLGRHMYPVHQC
jgi:hypothetical protein